MAMMQNKASIMPRHFVKVKVLGRGSYGTVFRAISTTLHGGDSDDVVAVKATSIQSRALSLQKEEIILNFFRYCPEIIQCYGRQITIENGIYVHNLILEYAPYGTLADLIKKGAFIESQVREYTRMLLRGLSWIHYKGLVHCDLKPENILVFPLDQNPAEIKMASSAIYQLKIADFGLAMTLEERNDFDPHCWTFRFRGTPFYMSPESVTHGEIKPALDIWSLGCIVLEMVAGLPPRWIWQITSANEFIYRLIFQTTTPKIPNSVSKDCRDFLSKCFDRNSKWRWTAGMLLHHPFVKPPKRSINT